MNYLIYHGLRLCHCLPRWLIGQVTPAGLGLSLGIVVALVFGGGAQAAMVHWLFFLALALLLLALLGSRSIRYQFRARRLLPRFGTVGEPLRYDVVVDKVTPQLQRGLQFLEISPPHFLSFQTFVQIKTRYPGWSNWWLPWRNHLAQQRLIVAHPQPLPTLVPGAKTKTKVELLPLKRGYLHLNTLSLACPDPLGLVYRHQHHALPQSVCILPPRYQLPALNLANRQQTQMTGTMLVNAKGESLEFRSLRDYRTGDPTNKIHWKSWAKVGEPIIKEDQAETSLHYGLILDSFQNQQAIWDLRSELFEAALAIAVSFLSQPRPEESRLDVIYAAPTGAITSATCLTVGRGIRQRAPVLESLATLQPCRTETIACLTPVWQTRLPYLNGCFCILLGLDAPRLAFLKMLAQSGLPTKVLCLSALGLEPGTNLRDVADVAAFPHVQITMISSLHHLQQELLSL
jgi:uncharacterized protein (DUF58 family)